MYEAREREKELSLLESWGFKGVGEARKEEQFEWRKPERVIE